MIELAWKIAEYAISFNIFSRRETVWTEVNYIQPDIEEICKEQGSKESSVNHSSTGDKVQP
ncbi:MAG: hypothetical protein QXK57_05160 [Conexivisphaerales archaeon]